MPLYEGIGLISEKNAVILDIGTAYTKCGVAGEPSPRFIVPSTIVDNKTKQRVSVFSYDSPTQLYDLLIEFIYHLYFRCLLVSPKDRRVLIIESLLSPEIYRETLTKVLLIHYEVPSILFAPANLMATYALPVSSALVVDVGNEETQVIPIYERVVMLHTGMQYNIAAQSIHSNIKKLMLEQCHIKTATENPVPASSMPELVSDELVEEFKVRACFVTTWKRAHGILLSKYAAEDQRPPPLGSPPDVDYPLQGSHILHVPGHVREVAMEPLFELDGERMSIATLILDCLSRCPVDTRHTLAENILLMGGSSMSPGFRVRLMEELKHLVQTSWYTNKLGIKSFKFHNPPGHANYVAWLGASIYGSTNTITSHSTTKDDYLQNGKLPDWSSVCTRSPDLEELHMAL